MKTLIVVGSLLLSSCTLHVSDTARDKQVDDLLARVQTLERGKADAGLTSIELQKRDAIVGELKEKVSALEGRK